MIVDVQGDEPPDISPACYFAGLQAAASYVIDNGLPFFASGHISFMRDYLKAWRTKSGDEAVREASADLAKLEEKTQHRLHPVLVQMGGLFRAVFSSSWMVLAKSIRIVPPLITAVVVVFVTSDAWRLLGTGFTPRTTCLVALFLVTSLVFLIRFKGYWEDDFGISRHPRTFRRPC